MQSQGLKADILVPKEFVWWAFLAFATDPLSPFEHIHFVSQLSDSSDVAILDSRLLPQDDVVVSKKRLTIVLLWDGYQSYLQRQSIIDHTRHVAQQFEVRVVGDTSELENKHSISCAPLFVQRSDVYDQSILSRERLKKFSFDEPFSRFALLHRSEMLSVKSFLHLATSRRLAKYKESEFVYCGQSGMATLQSYADEYGVGSVVFRDDAQARASERAFLSEWLSAMHRRPDHWANRIILRALLRVIALRWLSESHDQEVFMNIYPDPNVNAYQAGLLFKKHVFLDFGGINGDEAIYPRSADILFHRRRFIRFDLREAMRRLQEVNGSSDAASGEFLSWYAQAVFHRLHELHPQLANSGSGAYEGQS